MKSLQNTLLNLVLVCLLAVSTTAAAKEPDQAELDQMLAPVALYPDTVLTHVLIAATYPLEVVQAARWSEKNPKLSGDDAVRAVENEDWDPSVKALVAFPQLLKRMNDDLSWTQSLGEAFLADETQVLASIQQLRQKAYEQGSLNKLQHVVVEREKEVIVIEPARREVIYLPYYDTRVVYGSWWWPSYPPVYWHSPSASYTGVSFYWGPSVIVRPSFYFGIFDWHHRHIVVNHHYYHNPPRYYPRRHVHYAEARHWQHSPKHRRGVQYRHDRLNHTYSQAYNNRTKETYGVPGKVEYRRSTPAAGQERRITEQRGQQEQRQYRQSDQNRVISTEQLRRQQHVQQQLQQREARQPSTDQRRERITGHERERRHDGQQQRIQPEQRHNRETRNSRENRPVTTDTRSQQQAVRAPQQTREVRQAVSQPTREIRQTTPAPSHGFQQREARQSAPVTRSPHTQRENRSGSGQERSYRQQ